MRGVTTVAAGAAGLLLLLAAGAGPAPAAASAAATPCRTSAVHYSTRTDGDPSLAHLPWVSSTGASSQIIGHLFYYDAVRSVPWAAARTRAFRVYAGGRSADDRVNMKILWSSKGRDGRPMQILGRRLGRPGSFRESSDVGPSILNVPSAGCWRLELRVGAFRSSLTVEAIAP